VKASHNLARVSVTFDDDSLLPSGGLAVAGLLAQRLGVADLVDQHVRLSEAAANAGAKALTVIGSMLVGDDSIATPPCCVPASGCVNSTWPRVNGLYAAKRGSRPRSGVVWGVCQCTPQCRSKRSR